MKIKIIALGKIKEKYLQDGINEFLKRLQAYAKVEIIEINEVKLNDKPSLKDIEIALDKEAKLIEKHLNKDDYLITLDVQGKNITNNEYVELIEKACLNGYSTFTFIIGSSHGLSQNINKQAQFKWSFSKLVFTHQMIRLIVLEQVYRGFKIINNEPYHK